MLLDLEANQMIRRGLHNLTSTNLPRTQTSTPSIYDIFDSIDIYDVYLSIYLI